MDKIFNQMNNNCLSTSSKKVSCVYTELLQWEIDRLLAVPYNLQTKEECRTVIKYLNIILVEVVLKRNFDMEKDQLLRPLNLQCEKYLGRSPLVSRKLRDKSSIIFNNRTLQGERFLNSYIGSFGIFYFFSINILAQIFMYLFIMRVYLFLA